MKPTADGKLKQYSNASKNDRRRTNENVKIQTFLVIRKKNYPKIGKPIYPSECKSKALGEGEKSTQ